jgi:hypothetical protein
VIVVAGPYHGAAVIDPRTGTITYQPEAGYLGNDSIDYRVCDTAHPPRCATGAVLVVIGVPQTSALSPGRELSRPSDGLVAGAALAGIAALVGLIATSPRRRRRPTR